MATLDPAPAIDVTGDRPVIRLATGHHKRVRAGHPWAYSNEIAMTPETKALPPGSIVRLHDSADGPLGAAMFNPRPLISARLLTPDPDAAIDREFLSGRLAGALALRERLFDAPYYRLVWSEADGLPGLVLDRYGNTAAAQLNTAGMDRLAEPLTAALFDVVGLRTIVFRNDTAARRLEGLPSGTSCMPAPRSKGRWRSSRTGCGSSPTSAKARKPAGSTTTARTAPGSRALARGADVLDAYSYVGGFGIQAAAAGARSVVCLDRSEPALALGTEAAARNGVAGACEFLRGDVFRTLEEFGRDGRGFDIVVCDPPAFVKSKKDLASGLKGYRKADTPGGGVRPARRVPVRRVVLAPCRCRTVRRGFARRAAGHQAGRARAASRRRRARPPDPPLSAGERLSEGAAPATRLKRRKTCSGFSAAPPRPTSRKWSGCARRLASPTNARTSAGRSAATTSPTIWRSTRTAGCRP